MSPRTPTVPGGVPVVESGEHDAVSSSLPVNADIEELRRQVAADHEQLLKIKGRQDEDRGRLREGAASFEEIRRREEERRREFMLELEKRDRILVDELKKRDDALARELAKRDDTLREELKKRDEILAKMKPEPPSKLSMFAIFSGPFIALLTVVWVGARYPDRTEADGMHAQISEARIERLQLNSKVDLVDRDLKSNTRLLDEALDKRLQDAIDRIKVIEAKGRNP